MPPGGCGLRSTGRYPEPCRGKNRASPRRLTVMQSGKAVGVILEQDLLFEIDRILSAQR